MKKQERKDFYLYHSEVGITDAPLPGQKFSPKHELIAQSSEANVYLCRKVAYRGRVDWNAANYHAALLVQEAGLSAGSLRSVRSRPQPKKKPPKHVQEAQQYMKGLFD